MKAETAVRIRGRAIGTAVFLSIVIATSAHGQTLRFVDQSATGANNGLSWPDAYTDLQDALGEAALIAGQTNPVDIWVAEGTYKPDGMTPFDRLLSFELVRFTELFGGFPTGGGNGTFGARDPNRFVTTLSGDLAGDDGPGFTNRGENSFHVIRSDGVDQSATIDGFTISGGNADDPMALDGGGGALLEPNGLPADTIAPLFNRCIFEDNQSANEGGAIVVQLGLIGNFRNSTIRNNEAGADGGGVWAGGRVKLVGCAISDNDAGTGPGGGFGGGVWAGGVPELLDCDVIGNQAVQGGGIYALQVRMISCRVVGNEATDDGGGVWASTIGTMAGLSEITGCAFTGNTADGSGGGLYVSNFELVNCTVAHNTADDHGGGVLDVNAAFCGPPPCDSSTIDNCILYFNEDSGHPPGMPDLSAQLSAPLGGVATDFTVAAQPRANGNCIQGWSHPPVPGDNCDCDDPEFQDVDGYDDIAGNADDNYRLRCDSPCRNAPTLGCDVETNEGLLPDDTDDLDGDANLSEKTPDSDLNHRLILDTCNVDIGAFEAHSDCFGDCAGASTCTGGGNDEPDGVVNILDLNALLLFFGQPGGPCDIAPQCSGDGVVNVLDLLEWNNHFGNVCASASGGSGGAGPQQPGPLEAQPWMIQLLAVAGVNDPAGLSAWLLQASEEQIEHFVDVARVIVASYVEQ